MASGVPTAADFAVAATRETPGHVSRMLRAAAIAASVLALVGAQTAQLNPCTVDGAPSCATTEICGYVPTAYAGPNGTAVCAPLAAVGSCVPGVQVVQSTWNPPIVSAIVAVTVCDNNGASQPLGGASLTRFVLQEDGGNLAIESANMIAVAELPKLRTLVMVDMSYSMTIFGLTSYLSTINTTVTSLATNLRTNAVASPAVLRGHVFAVASFSAGQMVQLCDYINLADSNALAYVQLCLGKLDILPGDDSSDLYNSAIQAASWVSAASRSDPEYPAASPMYFNTVVMLTDGIDTANIASINAAIESNTVVAAIGMGSYLNTTQLQAMLPLPWNLPVLGSVSSWSTTVSGLLPLYNAKVYARAMSDGVSGHYFIRYCTASRGNANVNGGSHMLTISLDDPATGGSQPLANSRQASISFQAQANLGAGCNDRTMYRGGLIPGKMSTVNGGSFQYACAFTGANGYVDKFFCPTPRPTVAPSVVQPSSTPSPTPSNSYRPVPFEIVVQHDLDGHSVGAGIGITLSIFIAVIGSVVILMGFRAGYITLGWCATPRAGGAPTFPSAGKHAVVISANPLSTHDRASAPPTPVTEA